MRMLGSGVGSRARLLTSKLSRISIALTALATVMALAAPSWANPPGWGPPGHWRKERAHYQGYVYAPPPAYVVVPPPPVVYAAPAPVYVAPAPVYTEPSINLVFPLNLH